MAYVSTIFLELNNKSSYLKAVIGGEKVGIVLGYTKEGDVLTWKLSNV